MQNRTPQVSKERTGWRDLRLNNRHREWGLALPALDLDFLEYQDGRAVALIEYVHEYGRPKNPESGNMRALRNLGDRAGVPVFVVRYSDDFSRWTVTAMNDLAIDMLPGCVPLTETQFVEFLYSLRGLQLPAVIRDILTMRIA